MSGKRDIIVFALAAAILVASIAGVLQIAEARRAQADGTPSFAEVAPAPHTGVAGDPDHDGIVGAADRCPLQAETFNGFHDTDGCPEIVTTTRVS